jgi:hypothetical protein
VGGLIRDLLVVPLVCCRRMTILGLFQTQLLKLKKAQLHVYVDIFFDYGQFKIKW